MKTQLTSAKGRSQHKALTLLALLCTVVALWGCSSTVTPPEAVTDTPPVPKTTPVPTPAEEPAFLPTFERGTCPFDVPRGQAIECGFVVVPEDHRDPSGPTIRLAVAIFRDQSDDHHDDPVLLLSGGPGEKTVHNAPPMAEVLAPIHIGRDLILFDQRGVGLSEPALECPETAQVALHILDETDSAVAAETAFRAVMACRDRLVSEGHNLAAYNTTQNAADVDAIRIALGYDQVNLWGGSYGSLLAQATMRDYPEGIRSAVIESVLPLEESFLMRSSTTVANAILRLVDACTADAACNSAYPNLREVLFEVIDRMNAEPVPVTLVNPLDGQSYEAMLSGDAVLGILRLVLYQTATLPAVPQAIYGVYNGEFELMTQLGSLRLALLDAVTTGMQYSVFCTDDLIGRTEQDLLDARAALPRQLAGTADSEVFLKYGIMSVCQNWPVEEADPSVKLPLVSDIPTLVLSGEFDPVTPPAFGRLVAGYLTNSTFFEFPGTGHVGESTNACALSITAAFLEDPLSAPDGSCIAEMAELAFDVPSESAEIELTPYTNETLGVKGLVPAGWTEVQPGTFARASSALDVTVMQIAFAPSKSVPELAKEIAKGYGLPETPAAADQHQANGLDWSLYELEVQGVPRDLALAESEAGTLVFVLRSAADERAALYETVFLPVVDSLAPLQ